MSFALFVLGAVFSAVGIMMIGFGIPINEFSLGNTLIIAGTTALAGGVVVIGLAVTNRQLKRMTDQLALQQRGSEVQAFPVAARSEAARPPAPPKSRTEMPRQEPREAAFERPFAVPGGEEGDFNQPRMRAGAPPIFEQIEDVTLSPRTPPRMPGIEPAPHMAEPAIEQRAWRPPGMRQPAPGGEPTRKEAAPLSPERSAAASARTSQEGMFESIWPAGRRQERPVEPAAAPAPARAPDEVFHRAPAAPADTAVVSVLKSGVVDGMAYTLYTDGSIEAELAQGVVRFGSIEELRNHLEKSS